MGAEPMEVFEILREGLYQSGAPEAEADWAPIHAARINVVIDLFGTLDPGVPTAPNSILYVFWPIEDKPALPDMKIMDALTDLVVREIGDGHRVLVHCHRGKSRSGLFNAIVAMKMLNVDGRTAIDIVRRGRPGALGNQTFVDYLESLPAPGGRRGA